MCIWQIGQICIELVIQFNGVKEIVTHLCNILVGTTEREFRSGRAPFVSVKFNGFGNFLEHSEFYTLTAFGRIKSSEGGYDVSHACTLRKTGRTRVGVHTSYGTGNRVKSLVANDEKVFKNLTFH